MLTNILVATDGSEATDRMVECLAGLRRVGSQRALLTHVFDVRQVGGLYETLREGMRPRLEAQRHLLEQAGFEVTVETPLGMPFFEINAAADRIDASLIVVGSLGASMTSDVLLGSTAHQILQHARRPILLVRLEMTDSQEAGQRCRVVCGDMFGHILFPTDFSDTAERAFTYLEHIIEWSASAVTLLHVQDRLKLERHLHGRIEEFNAIDQARLDRMKDRLVTRGASSVETSIVYGAPLSVILEQARHTPYSLVVMGTQGRGAARIASAGTASSSARPYCAVRRCGTRAENDGGVMASAFIPAACLAS